MSPRELIAVYTMSACGSFTGSSDGLPAASQTTDRPGSPPNEDCPMATPASFTAETCERLSPGNGSRARYVQSLVVSTGRPALAGFVPPAGGMVAVGRA